MNISVEITQKWQASDMADLSPVLDQMRKDLLDLSARNRLLAAPRGERRGDLIEVIGERSEAVFEMLVRDRRGMGFKAGSAARDDAGEGPFRPDPPEDRSEPNAPARRDRWLQTGLSAERLHGRLLRLAYESRSLHEERGVHLLYLALGFLTWFEARQAEIARHAPLILIPVRLEQAGALERFRISFTEEEIVPNACLAEKLAREFGIALPPLPEQDDLEPRLWFRTLAEAVGVEPRFRVEADAIALGLFSFARLLMWRDLDPATWPRHATPDRHPLLRAVLVDGFWDETGGFDEADDLDRVLPARETIHVLDADGSQAVALEAARRGQNLLIQGPPGTGKSQTITNLIAASVHAGQRVLFVAEKMAALEVVRRRLEALDLGSILLELHSRRAKRRDVLDELRWTLDLGRPAQADPSALAAELDRARQVLNQHAGALHRRHEPSGFTPFELIGRLARLGAVESHGIVLDVDGLERAAIERRRGLITALGERIARMGDPARQLWRGVGLTVLLPADRRRILERAAALRAGLEALRLAAGRLAADLGNDDFEASSFAALESVLDTAEFLSLAPQEADRQALLDPVWQTRRDEINQLAAAGRARATLRRALEEHLAPAAFEQDVRDLAARCARLAGRWWRFLDPRWWACRLKVDRLFREPRPHALDKRLQLIDRLLRAQSAERHLRAAAALGRSAFGTAWRGARSDFTLLGELEHWEADGRAPHLLPQAPQRLALAARPELTAELARQSQRLLVHLRRDLETLFEELGLDPCEAFGPAELKDLPLLELEHRLGAWSTGGETLQDWVALRYEIDAAGQAGLDPLVRALLEGRIEGRDAGRVFDGVVFERLLQDVFRAEPGLAGFDGTSFSEWLERFRALDRERIDLARAEVALAHAQRVPRGVGGRDQLELLEQEFRKKRRHLSIRSLIGGAGGVIQAIKPVFMMSPLSVAEFLPPGAVEFDLLVIDEASQVEPAHALGAIARARQIVVVGDERQLPPTPFFRDGTVDDGEDERHPARDLESILGLCAARGMPRAMLRWHYRSRHPSLIAVSNRAFYDDRLLVAPSPAGDAPGLGIAFHYLADGAYERGGSRTNPAEAAWIARAVLDHARTRPELSLGVGCFSVQQRERILAELERLRRDAPELEPFFRDHGPEPFFVKNLETLQGDERDVVMISVGYGPDPSGYLAMSFGPLNAEGGERRLNVLISRSRRQLVVVASMRAADIELERSDRPGVRVLKTFLEYAESGVLGVPEPSGREPDSPFEVAVAAALRSAGLEVAHQVGSRGFFVDLAVVDPGRPGRYVLGIECDGAAWHSARWARDRDRLRQQVLEDQGWILHRIWSGDWFRRPETTLRRAVEAVEAAKVTWRARDEAHRALDLGRQAGRPRPAAPPIARMPAPPPAHRRLAIGRPYVEADFAIEPPVEPHQMAPDRLREALARIVEIEGPVHRDEIARRLTRLAGLSRTGRRIREVVGRGLSAAADLGRVQVDGAFYCIPGREIVVRDRSAVGSVTLKSPAMLPPAEVEKAILELVRGRMGVSSEDAVIQASRALGFQSTSAPLRELIKLARDRLIEGGVVDPDERGLLRERRPAA